jgi:hypothetical protein
MPNLFRHPINLVERLPIGGMLKQVQHDKNIIAISHPSPTYPSYCHKYIASFVRNVL